MDNNVYVTLSRQLALFRDMDVTSNNIANTNSTGYNAEHMMFTSYLTKDINEGDTNPMDFAYDISTYRDVSQGSIRATGNQLDVAMQSNAYFTVQTPLGTRYTRDGSFQMDGTGALTTADGYQVLDNAGQPITLPEDTVTVDIGSIGNIKVNGEDFATLGIAQFDNPQLLERLNSGLFSSSATPTIPDNPRVIQGALENSNVQPVVEMTHMMDVSRHVSDTAKFIEVMYDLQRKTASAWSQQS